MPKYFLTKNKKASKYKSTRFKILTAYSLQLTAYSLQLTAYSLQLTAYSSTITRNLIYQLTKYCFGFAGFYLAGAGV